ncbi:MAG: hypothetical protein AB9888_00025 [Bacteroidales bacterium]
MEKILRTTLSHRRAAQKHAEHTVNAQDYLTRLKSELKGLPPEEEALLIEEISSHFSEGQEDPRLGSNEGQRAQHLAREMGSPEDLARQLKNVHRPYKWLEYAIIVLPELILFPIASGIVSLAIPSTLSAPTAADLAQVIGIRFFIILRICLMLTGLKLYRNQGLKTGLFYWAASLWLSVLALCLRENRWIYFSEINRTPGGQAESIFWSLVWLGLLFILSSLLWKTKDPLWFTLVSIPVLTAFGNLATGLVQRSGGFPDGYILPHILFGWVGVFQLTLVIWPMVFIFPKQRMYHWSALLINAAPFALVNLIASARYPHLILLWSTPILLVSAAWVFDTFSSQRKQLLR